MLIWCTLHRKHMDFGNCQVASTVLIPVYQEREKSKYKAKRKIKEDGYYTIQEITFKMGRGHPTKIPSKQTGKAEKKK